MAKPPLSKPVAKALSKTGKKAPGKLNNCARDDLERIEADYRAGVLTTREIGRLHGISHTRVGQYAKQHGWQRDLTAKVQAAAAAKLAAAESPSRKAAESEVVDNSASAIVQIVLAHRASIRRSREIVDGMLGELEAAAPGAGLIEALRAAAAARGMTADEAQAIISKAGQVLTVGARANVAGQLATVLERSIAMERRAFSMDDGAAPQAQPAQPGVAAGPSASLLALRERFAAVLSGRAGAPDAA